MLKYARLTPDSGMSQLLHMFHLAVIEITSQSWFIEPALLRVVLLRA